MDVKRLQRLQLVLLLAAALCLVVYYAAEGATYARGAFFIVRDLKAHMAVASGADAEEEANG